MYEGELYTINKVFRVKFTQLWPYPLQNISPFNPVGLNFVYA